MDLFFQYLNLMNNLWRHLFFPKILVKLRPLNEDDGRFAVSYDMLLYSKKSDAVASFFTKRRHKDSDVFYLFQPDFDLQKNAEN